MPLPSSSTNRLIGHRAHDSDPLDRQLQHDRIELISPNKANRIKLTTARYAKRWRIERVFV